MIQRFPYYIPVIHPIDDLTRLRSRLTVQDRLGAQHSSIIVIVIIKHILKEEICHIYRIQISQQIQKNIVQQGNHSQPTPC